MIQASNVGKGKAEGVSWEDNLSEALDDATYNNDAVAETVSGTGSAGTVSISGAGTKLDWVAPDLNVGQTVNVTYTMTLKDPATGDLQLRNAIIGVGPGSNCPEVSVNPDADCSVAKPLPRIVFNKTVDKTVAEPGDTVAYTVTATNVGFRDADASWTDNLTRVLDDATYNNDASVTSGSGTVSYTEPNLTWAGSLKASESSVTRYTVTVADHPSDHRLTNTVVGTGPGSNCKQADSEAAPCATEVLVPEVRFSKNRLTKGVLTPGDTVDYQVVAKNIGATATPASWKDSLRQLLKTSKYNNDAKAANSDGSTDNVGAVTWEKPVLSWSTDSLTPGQRVNVEYSATVRNKVGKVDKKIVNIVVGTGPGSNCTTREDPNSECHTFAPIAWVQFEKRIINQKDVYSPGDKVRYEILAKHRGRGTIPAMWSDDLSGILDDARYNNDQRAKTIRGEGRHGSVVWERPLLSWMGDLNTKQTVSTKFSVTLRQNIGDGKLRNTVVGVGSSTNCGPESTNPECRTRFTIEKTPGLG